MLVSDQLFEVEERLAPAGDRYALEQPCLCERVTIDERFYFTPIVGIDDDQSALPPPNHRLQSVPHPQADDADWRPGSRGVPDGCHCGPADDQVCPW